MPCGCGGSGQAQKGSREQIRQPNERPRPPVSFGDPGFTWNGPERPAPKAPEPEPAK